MYVVITGSVWGRGVKSETQSEKAISEQPFFTAEYSI